MDKHAFLIGVFKNPDYLESLIASLDSERSVFFIHVNKKNISEFSSMISKYNNTSNVHFYSVVRYKWGGVGCLKYITHLLMEALKDKDISFFHFISGQDILIKPLNQLFDFFDNHKNNNFIDYGEWESNPWRKNGGLEIERYSLYNLFDIIDVRDNPRFVKYVCWFREIQRYFKIKRKPWPFENMFWGYCWWSFNRKGVEKIQSFLCVKSNWSFLNYTFAPEEGIFQNILLNSDISHTVVNNNLRYVDWSEIDFGSPKTLTEDDYSKLVESDAFFARKVDPHGKSKKLINMLKNYCKNN